MFMAFWGETDIHICILMWLNSQMVKNTPLMQQLAQTRKKTFTMIINMFERLLCITSTV